MAKPTEQELHNLMRRIARVQQRKRQTWLALPASGIEEVGHGGSAERIPAGKPINKHADTIKKPLIERPLLHLVYHPMVGSRQHR